MTESLTLSFMYNALMQELQAIVSGRVQMVMMRDFVKRSARALGLRGRVKNRSDGTVEVVAQGEHPVLEKLVEKLHIGSIFSRVDRVEVVWQSITTLYSDFNIDYSA